MSDSRHVAFDLGAESGRTLMGELSDGRLDVQVVNRFPNKPVTVAGHLHWNAFQLFEEMLAGLASCVGDHGAVPDTIGVDTWGVDFTLLDRDGAPIGLPFTYRDDRTRGAVESFSRRIPTERVHRLTGLQILYLNTLYQLESMVRDRAPALEIAKDLLFMPDFFHYLLTGVKKTEYTFATTSQLLNAANRSWEPAMFDALGLPISLMQEIVMPGTVLGELSPVFAKETGVGPVSVVAVATHDTGSAVAAIPAEGDDWAFISSGTWSIMGVPLDAPVTNELTFAGNFSNEGTATGGIRLLKNISALYLVQQCRRAWSAGRPPSYDELTKMAEEAEPFVAVLDPDAPEFANPADMPSAIADYLRKTGQRVPETRGGIVRCALESIALKYRSVLEQLRSLTAHPIRKVHIVGGGTQNRLLCELAADAMGLPVLAGPLEATAIGNILMQAKAAGRIASHDEIRAVVRRSFSVERYEPEAPERWQSAYERFRELEAR
jgi:rhamnulokinase